MLTVHTSPWCCQFVGSSLTLVEDHVWGIFHILIIVLPAVVEAGHLGMTSQFGWDDITLDTILLAVLDDTAGTGRIHGNGRLTCRIQTLHEGVHDVIGRTSPVACRETTTLLLEL